MLRGFTCDALTDKSSRDGYPAAWRSSGAILTTPQTPDLLRRLPDQHHPCIQFVYSICTLALLLCPNRQNDPLNPCTHPNRLSC